MKIRRIIYLVLGCLLMICNLFAYLGTLSNPDGQKTLSPEERGDPAIMAGWYFGLNLPLIIGLVFFWLAYRVTKKIKKKKEQEMVDSF
jgi:hypothetical protein